VQKLPVENAVITEGLASLPFKNKTAREWIMHPTNLDHKDPASGITVKSFLALFWLAANNDECRERHVTKEAACGALINALYEIQRGYNLNSDHNPKDNGRRSGAICAGGTFNKVSEKLVSVIKGTSQVVITLHTLSQAVGAKIKEKISQLRQDAEIDEALKNNKELLTEKAWDKIKESVISAVKEDFKEHKEIAGRTLEVAIAEQTDFNTVLQYFSVS
jgi:hypothetical protein